jgi:hypothetical protein
VLAGNHHPVAVFAALQFGADSAQHQPEQIRGALVWSPVLLRLIKVYWGPTELYSAGRRVSAAVAPRDTAMNNTTAALAARLADLQQRSRDTDEAAAADLQQLLRQGQQLADAMTAAAEAMEADSC